MLEVENILLLRRSHLRKFGIKFYDEKLTLSIPKYLCLHAFVSEAQDEHIERRYADRSGKVRYTG